MNLVVKGDIMNIPNLPNLPLDANGWSILKESVDTKKYYISTSGNDANDGLSQDKPLKTLKMGVSKLRNNAADWILLKSGDSWDESLQLWGKNGRSPLERTVITSYGGNSRPKISLLQATGEGIKIAKSQNVAVVGIHVRAAEKDPKNPSYNPKAKKYHGISIGEINTNNVLIEDCFVELFETNILLVYVTDKPEAFNKNIVVRRNVLVDSWSPGGKAMNLYASGMTDFIIEENVFDKGGHVPEIGDSVQTGFSHNIYLSSNNGPSYIYRNILARPASHGAQQRAGGLMQDNLSINCAHHHLIGLHDSETAYNVGIGCINLPTTRMGFGIEVKSAQNCNVHHNLLLNKQPNIGGWPAYKFTFNSTVGFIGGTTIPLTHNAIIKIHDNISYQWDCNEGVMRIDTINDSDVTVEKNKLLEVSYPQSLMYFTQLGGAKHLFKDNQYSTDQPLSSFAKVDGAKVSFADWKSKTGDNSVVTTISFPDASRTIETYCAKIGIPKTINDFMLEARKQSRFNWKQEFRATIVNDYMREGFGLPLLNDVVPPPAKPVVDKVFLRSIATGQDIQELKDGDMITLSLLPASLNIRAEIIDGTAVRFNLDGNSILEKNKPYCYPGDDVPLLLTEGKHVLTVIAYGNDDGKTNPSDTVTINFSVQKAPVVKPIVESVWLRDLATKADIKQLKEGDLLTLSELPKFNFRIQIKDGTAVRSSLDGVANLEVNAPYCYPSDDNPVVLVDGDRVFETTAYGNDDGVTNPGDKVIINFKVQKLPPAKIDKVTVLNTHGESTVFESTDTKGIDKVVITYSDGSTDQVAL